MPILTGWSRQDRHPDPRTSVSPYGCRSPAGMPADHGAPTPREALAISDPGLYSDLILTPVPSCRPVLLPFLSHLMATPAELPASPSPSPGVSPVEGGPVDPAGVTSSRWPELLL